MLAARRRQKTPYQFLDARVDVAAVEGARPDDGVRGSGPSRKIISLVGILLIQTPRARAGDDARLLVVVAGSRLRALEFGGGWPSMLGLEPSSEIQHWYAVIACALQRTNAKILRGEPVPACAYPLPRASFATGRRDLPLAGR